MADYAHGVASVPGVTPEVTSQVRRFLKNSDHVVKKAIVIPSDVVDSTNTPTTKLRPGLALVRVIAGGNTGKYVPAGHADIPADNDIAEAVILSEYVNMLGQDGVAEEKHAQGFVHCFVEEGQILFDTVTQGTIDAIKAALPQVLFMS